MELPNQLITIAQAAAEFGINPKTLETWHHRGEITRIGTAPKDRARPGRRAGLYDRAEIEAAVAARAAGEQGRFDPARGTGGNGVPPSSAHAAGLPGIRRTSAVPTNQVVHATRAGGPSETRLRGQYETTGVAAWSPGAPAKSKSGRGLRTMSIQNQLAHQLTTQRCARPGCGLPLNALTVQERDEFCSMECARAHHDARRPLAPSVGAGHRR